MGQYTPEKEDQIYEIYQEIRSYNKTAAAAGVDPRTVKRIVEKKRGRTAVDQSPQIQNPSELRSKKLKERGKGTSKDVVDFFKEASIELCLSSFPETQEFAEIFEKSENGTKEQFLGMLQALMEVHDRARDILQPFRLPQDWVLKFCTYCGKAFAAVNTSDELGRIHAHQPEMHPTCSLYVRMMYRMTI